MTEEVKKEEIWTDKRFLLGLAVLVLGIIALIFPYLSITVFTIVIGILGILYGVNILSKRENPDDDSELMKGIIFMGVGAVFVASSFILPGLILFILAVLFIIAGVFVIAKIGSLDFKTYDDKMNKQLIIGIVLIALGVIILVLGMQLVGLVMVLGAIYYFYTGMDIKVFENLIPTK